MATIKPKTKPEPKPEPEPDDEVEDTVEKSVKSISTTLKASASVLGALLAILGSIWAFDSHYATAADLENVTRGVAAQVQQIRQERVEDELFKLDVKKQMQGGKLEAPEQALYDRYTRRLEQVRVDARDSAAKATESQSRGFLGFGGAK